MYYLIQSQQKLSFNLMKKQRFSVSKPPHHTCTLIPHRSGKFKALVFHMSRVSSFLALYQTVYIYICSMNDSQMFTVVKSQKTKCTLRIYVKEIIESICVLSGNFCEEAMCGFNVWFSQDILLLVIYLKCTWF